MLFHEIANNYDDWNLKCHVVHIIQLHIAWNTLAFLSPIPLFDIESGAMPCIFAGIFYVESLSANRQLQCHFKDDDNVVHHLNLTHFQSPNTTNHPFPDAFEMVQSGSVYFIAGTFAIQNKDNILVTPYTI